MRKTNFMKILLIIAVVTILVSIATSTFAATDNDVFDQLYLNNSTNNGAGLDLTNNTAKNNTSTNTNNTNTNSNRNNSSNYNKNNNSASLPKTGIEDSIPVALLVVVFGISAVYAYKKISEYKNI